MGGCAKLGVVGAGAGDLWARAAVLLHSAFVRDSPGGDSAGVSLASAGELAVSWRILPELSAGWAAVWAWAGCGLRDVDWGGGAALFPMCVVRAGEKGASGYAVAVFVKEDFG